MKNEEQLKDLSQDEQKKIEGGSIIGKLATWADNICESFTGERPFQNYENL